MKKKKLEEIRDELGLSQEEMAHKLHMTLASYNHKENYKTKFWADELIELCDIYEKMTGKELSPRVVEL